uniref:Uncharacterized protein n=1 Tax=Octopus bimaculoides TaxID=37653 RepID=A0A0L8HPI0_OCTBM
MNSNTNNNLANTNNVTTNDYINRSENNNDNRNYEDNNNMLNPTNHNFNQQIECSSIDVEGLTEVDDRLNSNENNRNQGPSSYNINMPNVGGIILTDNTSGNKLNNDGNDQYILNSRI